MTILLVIVAVLVVFAAYLIVIYNSFVAKRNKVEEALSGIDVILKKRFDLIPNLIESVKGYLNHEKETLSNIVNLRNQALGVKNPDEKLQLDKQLNNAVGTIFALAESYPDLKANTNFLSLQSELSEIETEIERSKRYYNGTVREYNIAVESFPGNLVANSFGFPKKNFLELQDESQRETPKVQF
ncbi:LemA family protein [Flavobacterium sp. Fl-77]|uniref:LemA family protein n=1 Tax=Flavobacterium flavipigmentatum TaxID=2893884 RepID=A0AAJ2SJ59_9FLAO|nr:MULTISPECIES: LemA family protein [unclassified Flavobacterium]MDX6183830.1 LemA family protein [Flavobacterium sp. Fl-33]MDX6187426.1 LemA family protein [Flavobacterium sp. Fl-77]UFH40328.1 LemA family protein [Flavobacterium sp. F-70]